MFGVTDLIVSWEQRLIVSVLVALISFGLILGLRRLRRRLRKLLGGITADLLTSTLIAAVVILGALVVIDLWGQTEVVLGELEFLHLHRRGPELLITVVIIIAIQVLTGIARRLLDDLVVESGTLTEHQREVGYRVSQLGIWTIGFIVILGVWEIDLTGILVGAGFLGIVVGLAARKTIGSLIAGLVLMFSRPFEVGDWIVVGEHEGTVTDITLLSTRAIAVTGERIVIPNDVVTGEVVLNRTREGRYRGEVNVGVDYEDSLETAVTVATDVATQLAASAEAATEEPTPSVLIRSFGDSAILLSVRIWTDDPTRGAVSSLEHRLVEQLKASFDEEGLSIPYPQRALSTRDSWRGGPIEDSRDQPRSDNTDTG